MPEHSAPPAPLRALGSRDEGQVVGRDLDAASVSRPLGTLIDFLSPFRRMHVWLWRSARWATFCRSADSGVLSLCSFIATTLVRQVNVEYISTATEYSGGHQAISGIVIMHSWRCATSRRGHR